MPKKTAPPAMPNIFIPDSLPEINDARFEEQMRVCSGIMQKQVAQVMSYCAKNHGCVHERAIVLGVLSAFVTVLQSVIEPSNDPAIRAMRVGSLSKMTSALTEDAPVVLSNMARFYGDLALITLSEDSPSDPEPAPAKPQPKTSTRHLN